MNNDYKIGYQDAVMMMMEGMNEALSEHNKASAITLAKTLNKIINNIHKVSLKSLSMDDDFDPCVDCEDDCFDSSDNVFGVFQEKPEDALLNIFKKLFDDLDNEFKEEI